MRLAINEFELEFARNYFSVTLGNRLDLILHKWVPGRIAPYSRKDETHVIKASYVEPARHCHDTHICFRDWELVMSRTWPVPGSTPRDFGEDTGGDLAIGD